jgi:REP element-mobilizing transposase RayT
MRKPLRLPHFDYSSPGAYFVTITVQHRAPLLGSLNARAEVDLSPAGRMVEDWWARLPENFPRVTLDAHSAMPDHLHGIILLDMNEPSESQ